jgi:hypothetical protein
LLTCVDAHPVSAASASSVRTAHAPREETMDRIHVSPLFGWREVYSMCGARRDHAPAARRATAERK